MANATRPPTATAISAIAEALGRENYMVEKLVLAQAGSVPDDAAVVIVAGPKTDFFPPEIEALKKYLDKAGKLLLEIDPPDKADAPPFTNLIALAHEWGMDVGNDIVVDASGMGRLIGTDASSPVVATYGSHPITENFSFVTAFPLSRSVTPVMGGVNGRTAQPFAQTSPQSWAEADIKDMLATGKVSLDESKGDKKGPITIAAAASAASTSAATPRRGSNPLDPEAPKPETRVAVVGDSDFAANAGLGIQGNRDLFMNTLGWLSQQENLIAIRPKNPEDRRITLTDDPAAQHHLAFAAGHSGLHFRHRRLLLGAEATLNARPAIHDRAAGRPDRPRRLHLLRRFEDAGERARATQERVFVALDGDKIDEIKVKSESGETTT